MCELAYYCACRSCQVWLIEELAHVGIAKTHWSVKGEGKMAHHAHRDAQRDVC